PSKPHQLGNTQLTTTLSILYNNIAYLRSYDNYINYIRHCTTMKKILFILLISLIGLRAQAQVINYSAHLAGPSPSEYQSGQYMFIDFWATWCIPCIKSMDHIEYLQSLFSDKVFFINMS